jgi:phage terminase small subunit
MPCTVSHILAPRSSMYRSGYRNTVASDLNRKTSSTMALASAIIVFVAVIASCRSVSGASISTASCTGAQTLMPASINRQQAVMASHKRDEPRKKIAGKGKRAERKLSTKQLKFIEAYVGNGVEAARLAGYKGSYKTLDAVARENLEKPRIKAAIRAREETEVRPLVATRQRRQEFWTLIMENPDEDIRARLKASELLGRSEGDFTDRSESTLKVTAEMTVKQFFEEIQNEPLVPPSQLRKMIGRH